MGARSPAAPAPRARARRAAAKTATNATAQSSPSDLSSVGAFFGGGGSPRRHQAVADTEAAATVAAAFAASALLARGLVPHGTLASAPATPGPLPPVSPCPPSPAPAGLLDPLDPAFLARISAPGCGVGRLPLGGCTPPPVAVVAAACDA